jgi:hypothetical protein
LNRCAQKISDSLNILLKAKNGGESMSVIDNVQNAQVSQNIFTITIWKP